VEIKQRGKATLLGFGSRKCSATGWETSLPRRIDANDTKGSREELGRKIESVWRIRIEESTRGKKIRRR